MSGRHSPAVAQLDQWEADCARRRALELVAEWDTIPMPAEDNGVALITWGAQAAIILKEFLRG